MTDKLMYIHIPNENKQKYPFCRLQLVVDTQLNQPTIQNSVKVPKVIKPTNK